MTEDEVDVVMIDERQVLMCSGTLLPVTNWFDDDGDECEPDDAVTCVAGDDERGWYSIEILPADTVH
jgi:hypothetical protein